MLGLDIWLASFSCLSSRSGGGGLTLDICTEACMLAIKSPGQWPGRWPGDQWPD